jgi:uncharacterized membrane protein YgcG
MTPHKAPAGTAAAPLLYWLLVVCGLAGITVVRIDTPAALVPLWVGTVVGVALGQLLAWLRMRAWLLAVFTMGGFWFAPMFFFVIYESFGGPAETCIFAFLPAAICGYLSLSERGGLVAFWYPAVLWMLVVLDGPVPGAFDAHASLPLLIGLAVLFVAFLRARETRRVALWQAHASARLATPLPRSVLRASPLRATSQLVWTGFVGAAALVLAAWIAPHLWQKEQARHPSAAPAQATTGELAEGASGGTPCCPEPAFEEEKRVRVREYFPLFRGRGEGEHPPSPPTCSVCRDGKSATSGMSGTSGGVIGGTSVEVAGSGGGGSGGGGGTSTAPMSGPTPTGTTTPSPVDPATPSAAPKPTTSALVPVVPPPAVVTASSKPTTSAKHATVVVMLKPAAPVPRSAPWKSVLAFCVGGLALHVLVRGIRRQLTLRHLARPFWAETLDQRISNHWERMLIGLRDAGIHPAVDEQPEALARRVAIEGMETCSTILERVRHGVRVDEADLQEMGSAADAVYRAAREKAGVSGRAAAWLRWPLA